MAGDGTLVNRGALPVICSLAGVLGPPLPPPTLPVPGPPAGEAVIPAAGLLLAV